MKKKGTVTNNKPKKKRKVKEGLNQELTSSQKAADIVTTIVGSWKFIILFLIFMAIWMYMNVQAIIGQWDPYPFILLNFVLSCLAAIQAPIILMSQNRVTERDRIAAKYDYQVNRKAEREIQKVLKELTAIKKKVYGDLNTIKTTEDKMVKKGKIVPKDAIVKTKVEKKKVVKKKAKK